MIRRSNTVQCWKDEERCGLAPDHSLGVALGLEIISSRAVVPRQAHIFKRPAFFRNQTRQLLRPVMPDLLAACASPRRPWLGRWRLLLDPHPGLAPVDHGSNKRRRLLGPQAPWVSQVQDYPVVGVEGTLVDEDRDEIFAPARHVLRLDVPMGLDHSLSVLRLGWLARPYRAGTVEGAVWHPNQTASAKSLFCSTAALRYLT